MRKRKERSGKVENKREQKPGTGLNTNMTVCLHLMGQLMKFGNHGRHTINKQLLTPLFSHVPPFLDLFLSWRWRPVEVAAVFTNLGLRSNVGVDMQISISHPSINTSIWTSLLCIFPLCPLLVALQQLLSQPCTMH